MGAMSYNKLRIGRTSIHGQVYLVTTVTLDRQRLFVDLSLGRITVNAMRALDNEGASRTLAFVVMPDHVHWLFELGRSHTLTAVIKLFKGRSAQAVIKHFDRRGSIWQPSFHDHAVRTEDSLLAIARYVIMNPVRAGIVERIADYPLWDSAWLE
jgi:REP element-mobilizing transposase RayT